MHYYFKSYAQSNLKTNCKMVKPIQMVTSNVAEWQAEEGGKNTAN